MADELGTREKILSVATELLIRNGFGGFRFSDVAERLNITRANIHYHFGNKENLAEEVVVRYVDVTLERFGHICLDRASTLDTKIHEMAESNRARYLTYNPTENTGNAWSLIARMRLERDMIGPRARRAIEKFSAGLDRYVRQALEISIDRGELKPDAPVNDLALLIAAIANSADPITRDASSFDRLAELYGGFSRIATHAYGLQSRPQMQSPKPRARAKAVPLRS